MDYEKAKQIKKELSKFLPCQKYAFVGPSDPQKLELFLKRAWNHSNEQKPLIRLMIYDSRIDKMLKEEFSDADFEVYVVPRYFNATTNPQTFREFVQTDDIDFDVSKFI